MKVVRALTIFILGPVVFIVVAMYQFSLLVDPSTLYGLVWGILGGLVLGIIGGIFLSLRFTKYFREKIWPSETDAA